MAKTHASNPDMALLSAQRLTVSIAGIPVCNDLDLVIEAGDRWCLLGRNGAGKTTLLHTLAGMHRPDGGSLSLHGNDLAGVAHRSRARQIGLLPQDHADAFPATVLETVLTGRHPWLSALQWEGADDYRIARNALGAVELGDMEARNVATLSGGERRRLGIATLLAQDPQLLLLDEPSNHLDIHQQVRMLDLLRQQAAGKDKALCVVMHDLNLATRCCDKFLLLFGDGNSTQGAATTVLTRENLQRLYQHPLHRIDGPSGAVWIPE
jgi:iron complex transport system ATP-binding protein